MEQSRIWHYYQTQAREAFSAALPRLDHLAAQLRGRLASGLVVNIGVGDGEFEALLHGYAGQVVSLDPDPASLAAVHARTGAAGIAGRIQRLPFRDGSVDAIVVSEVLEHLPDDVLDAGLEEIRRVLRSGGWIFGTVPCNEDLGMSTVICPHCGHVFHKVGHVRSFSPASLSAALSRRFQIDRIRRKAFIRARRMTAAKRLVAMIREPLVLAGALTRDEHLLFIGRKPG